MASIDRLAGSPRAREHAVDGPGRGPHPGRRSRRPRGAATSTTCPAPEALDLPDTHDPDWWVNQRIASGDIDSEALLPVVVLLRKEYERRDGPSPRCPTRRPCASTLRTSPSASTRTAREPLPADAGAGVGRGRRGRALASGAGSGSRRALGHLRAGRRAADPAPAVVALRATGWAGVGACECSPSTHGSHPILPRPDRPSAVSRCGP